MVGPFWDERSVSEFLGTDKWICIPRFGITQERPEVDPETGQVRTKIKNRGVDSATEAWINLAAEIKELLKLGSVDKNVAIVQKWRSRSQILQGKKLDLAGWALDERRAYRQIGIKVGHRRWSVIIIIDYRSGRVTFWVMIGHSFGLTASVYNYNRRSRIINEILLKEFGIVASYFYDDKFGIELEATVRSALQTAKDLHRWIGADFEESKTQISKKITILGVLPHITTNSDLETCKLKRF